MRERLKKPLFAHFIAYYSKNILDSVISWPHTEVTSCNILYFGLSP